MRHQKGRRAVGKPLAGHQAHRRARRRGGPGVPDARQEDPRPRGRRRGALGPGRRRGRGRRDLPVPTHGARHRQGDSRPTRRERPGGLVPQPRQAGELLRPYAQGHAVRHDRELVLGLPGGEPPPQEPAHIQASPTRTHQRIVLELYRHIANYIEIHHGPCEVLAAPFAVNLNADDKTLVEPDVMVICDPKKSTDRQCMGAPDLVVAVVSPSNKRMDYVKNTTSTPPPACASTGLWTPQKA